MLLLPPPGSTSAELDWTPIAYADGVGCGLHVQFFAADGSEPTVQGKPSAFFPAGAPPSTSTADCQSKCREWASLSIVKKLATGYRKNLAVTRVTGTCYLQRKPLGPPQAIATD